MRCKLKRRSLGRLSQVTSDLFVEEEILAVQYGPLSNCSGFSMGVNPIVLIATQNSPTFGE